MMPDLSEISVKPLRPGDIALVAAHPAFAEASAAQVEQLEALALAQGQAFTVRFGDGDPVFCGGVIESHGNHATGWSIMAGLKGRRLHAVHWRTRQFLHGLPHARVDCYVRDGFEAGHRWALRLGHYAEARLEEYFDNGEAAVIYRLKRN